MLKLVALIFTAIVSVPTAAQSLFLTCKTTATPPIELRTFYKDQRTPKLEQFVKDMILLGLAGMLGERAESWQVDMSTGRISSPEENSGPVFTEARVSETAISASKHFPKTSYSYDVNRITGKLTYGITLGDDILLSWQEAHGGSIPAKWQWEQACTSSSRLKV